MIQLIPKATLSGALVLLGIALTGCASGKEDSLDAASNYRLEGVDPPVYYSAAKPLEVGDKGRTAVILIHGWGGGLGENKDQLALRNALQGAYVISPLFPRAQVMKKHKVAPDGRAIWNDSWPLDLSIPGRGDDDWRGGGDADSTSLSSFDVIDRILDKLSDKKLYPRLKRVALVGFSAGGQFVSRYVAVGKGRVRPGLVLRYAAMSPSTFLFPDTSARWHYGLKDRPRYSRGLTEEQILENLRTRPCFYACGNADTLEKSLDMTPLAMARGKNRYDRFLRFREDVRTDPLRSDVSTFYVFDSLGHKAVTAYADPAFVKYILGK